MLVSCVSVLSQNSVDFILCNELKMPVSYANIYCKESGKGAYSDMNGRVKFSNILEKDTLVISCIGYEKRLILASELTDTIYLKTYVKELKEFRVKSEYEQEVIGIKRKSFIVSHSEGRFAGSVNGITFTNSKESFIENISLFIEKPEDSSRTRFLLMIYSVDDSTCFPKESILTNQLFFDVTKRGWSTINLDSLDIRVSGNFFIGIESVPNFNFNDAPEYFDWVDKPTAKYRCVTYLFSEMPMTWIWGYSGDKYYYGIDGTEDGAHNNFPLIKATIKY